jgi:hypothetical protein
MAPQSASGFVNATHYSRAMEGYSPDGFTDAARLNPVYDK